MAKGATSKEKIKQKILEIFDGAFEYGKELRIPMNEDGNRVEIKVALTCANNNVGGNADSAFPEPKVGDPSPMVLAAPTEEEKQNIADLMAKLGI